MMLASYFNTFYQNHLVAPVLKKISHKLQPNQITLIAALLGSLVFPALYFHLNGLAILLLLISGYGDSLDGALARLTFTTSEFGSILDIMCDRLVEFMVILGLFAFDPIHRSWGVVWMLGSILLCITSFLVVGIFTANHTEKGFYYSPGLMERAEAFLFFLFMILLPSYFNLFALIFTLLVSYTAIFRIFEYHKLSNK